MTLLIDPAAMRAIQAHIEAAYPEEGAGLLLGAVDGENRRVTALFLSANSREASARHNRYLISAQDMLVGEDAADRQGLAVVGVFHSHPDHPDRPSEFDREWALPWYTYLITQVAGGQLKSMRAWRLAEDRSAFQEETVAVSTIPE